MGCGASKKASEESAKSAPEEPKSYRQKKKEEQEKAAAQGPISGAGREGPISGAGREGPISGAGREGPISGAGRDEAGFPKAVISKNSQNDLDGPPLAPHGISAPPGAPLNELKNPTVNVRGGTRPDLDDIGGSTPTGPAAPPGMPPSPSNNKGTSPPGQPPIGFPQSRPPGAPPTAPPMAPPGLPNLGHPGAPRQAPGMAPPGMGLPNLGRFGGYLGPVDSPNQGFNTTFGNSANTLLGGHFGGFTKPGQHSANGARERGAMLEEIREEEEEEADEHWTADADVERDRKLDIIKHPYSPKHCRAKIFNPLLAQEEELFCYEAATVEKPLKRLIPEFVRIQLGDILGQGSHGTVYEGRREDTGEIIAVKSTPIDDTEAIGAMRKEIALLAQLNHPNCIDFLGSRSYMDPETYEVTHLQVFLALVPGGTISDMINTYGRIQDDFVLRSMSYQCTRGLFYLHKKGVVHRDLKGSNVLVGVSGECILTDMGTAFVAGKMGKKAGEETMKSLGDQTTALGSSATIMMSTMCGSIPWMAPEVVMMQGYKKTADIWSLGGLVIEMASGSPPWAEKKFDNPFALMMQLSVGTTLPEMPEDISDDCKAFVEACLIRDAKQRPTCAQLLETPFLRDVAQGVNILPPLITSPIELPWGKLADVCDISLDNIGG